MRATQIPKMRAMERPPIRLPATIALTAPNGGETWDIGTVHNITWTTTAINNIKIEFSSNSGGTWTTVTSVLASLGTYHWTIPGPTHRNNCLIKMCDVSNASNSDISNLAFKIVQPPSITITSPNGTEAGWWAVRRISLGPQQACNLSK